MEDFPRFHSDIREAVQTLTDSKSEVVHDEVFMRAFLCRALDVPELQYHTKELVNDIGVSWTQIFERIQKNYCSIESTEALRSGG